MADLLGDHIGLGKLARVAVRAAAELVLQIVEKRGVEINALIDRAVERAHRRARQPAAARLGAGEQPQLGRMVGAAAGPEDFGPAVLVVAKHEGDEAAGCVGWRSGLDWRSLPGLLRGCPAGGNPIGVVGSNPAGAPVATEAAVNPNSMRN